MTFGRYVLTADVTVPAGVPGYPGGGPATTASGTTSATPAGGTTVTSQTLAPGTFMLDWTAVLQTAAAAGDANNFGLYSGTVLLATSVNAGVIASYPQAAVSAYVGSAATVIAVKNIGAGTTGAVYNASLTVTPLLTGTGNGTVAWSGTGSPAGWAAPGWPVKFKARTPLYLDTAGPLYAAIGSANLRAWIDGTDSVGHASLSN